MGLSVCRIRYTRTCAFCGGEARVLGPPGWDDLDVDAEFSSEGRSFGEDGEYIGCRRCSRKRWKETPDA